MIRYIKLTIGIFLILAASRFVPHLPNFTSLVALSFYVPLILGLNFIPALILCFIITDLVIGFHSTIFFTWGSVILIGFLTLYFNKSLNYRLCGSLVGAIIFFIVSNFQSNQAISYQFFASLATGTKIIQITAEE